MGNDNAIGANHTDPKASIVIPAYNVERYFEECLSSIEGQSYRNLEIIVVDDGSTDKTLEIARTHAESDSRIKVITQQNQYAGVARNNGMSVASGDYICFLDADDVFRPFMIEDMVIRAMETKSDVVVCRSSFLDDKSGETAPNPNSLTLVDTEGVFSGFELRDVMFKFCVGWPWDKLYKSSYVRESGLRFQPLRTTNDAFFVFMSLIRASRISFVDEECVLHRVNNKESLENTRDKSCKNALTAVASISDELRSSGLYPDFEQSFLGWAVNFLTWNISTLSEENRSEFAVLMKETVSQLISPDIQEGYFYSARDDAIAGLLTMNEADVLSKAIMLAVEKDDFVDKCRALQDGYEGKLRALGEELSSLRLERDRLSLEVDKEKEARRSVENSRTFRVGKAIMALPCMLKDAVDRRKS